VKVAFQKPFIQNHSLQKPDTLMLIEHPVKAINLRWTP
jgi:hypothetical protein